MILGILPEYRNMGGGTLLVEYAKKTFSKKYDYFWGGHAKSLNNISFWTKHRRIVGEIDNNYVTLVDLKQ